MVDAGGYSSTHTHTHTYTANRGQSRIGPGPGTLTKPLTTVTFYYSRWYYYTEYIIDYWDPRIRSNYWDPLSGGSAVFWKSTGFALMKRARWSTWCWARGPMLKSNTAGKVAIGIWIRDWSMGKLVVVCLLRTVIDVQSTHHHSVSLEISRRSAPSKITGYHQLS